MSNNHSGNLLNQVTFEEHDGTLNAKRVTITSGATVYAVVNTSAAGQASVVLDSGLSNIGFATVAVSTPTLYAVVNTSAPGISNSIVTVAGMAGNVTLDPGSRTGIVGNVTLSDSKGFIGLVTVGNTVSTTFSGNITLDDGSLTGIIGNLTLSDSKGFIGLATVNIGSSNATLFAVVNTSAAGQASVRIDGNVTLSDAKTFIGLTTTTLGNSSAFIGIVTITNASIPVTQSGTWDEVGINDSGNSITVDNNGTFAVQSTFAGNVTLDAGSKTQIVGNVTLSDAKTYVGLVTATVGNNPVLGAGVNNIGFASVTPVAAWPDPKTYIGLVTITGSLAPAAGNITLDAGSKTQIVGNLTLSDAKTFIGLTTTTLGASPAFVGIVTIANASLPVTFSGNVTLDDGSLTGIVGNVTLSDAKTYIGLTTATLGASPAFVGIVTIANASMPVTFSGNVTLDDGSLTGIIGNVTLSDSKTFIGLTTTTLGASPAFIGIVTVTNASIPVTQSGTWDEVGINDSGNSITIDGNVGIAGNVTLSDAKTYIGLVTVGGGLSSVNVVGNVTLSDPKTFIGLVTSVPSYGSNSTVYTGIISASGAATVLVAPASNRFFIKNIHISSLGRSEVEIRSGATTLIPFTSLSTTSGYALSFGEQGLPGRAQTDGLVVNLNGAATVAYMFNVRFEA